MRRQFDVIVIGGGPAGSMTAYRLARRGLAVAVLDAKRFPRHKACGGGLQARTIQNIPFDISDVLRGAMRKVELSFALTEPCTRTYPDPLVYSVLRSEFDHRLLQIAAEAGAAVFQGVRVRGFSVTPHAPVAVSTEAGELEAEILVGADGANSVVSRLLNKRESFFWQAAIYCEVPEEFLDPGRVHHERMHVDWGTLPSGYAWAFPKRGYVNVGAGGPLPIARFLKAYATRFLGSMQILKPGVLDRLIFAGHQLPTLTSHTRLSGHRVLLVGDAAGLVEPFTGDGLSFACQSARVAAECIGDVLGRGEPDLRGYDSALKLEVGMELQWARKLLSLSAAFPRLIYRLFKSNDRAWLTFCRILRGEASFEQLIKDALGPTEIAWRIIDSVARRRERRALDAGTLPVALRHLTGGTA